MSEIVNIVGASSLLWPVCWLINKYQKGNSVKSRQRGKSKLQSTSKSKEEKMNVFNSYNVKSFTLLCFP